MWQIVTMGAEFINPKSFVKVYNFSHQNNGQRVLQCLEI